MALSDVAWTPGLAQDPGNWEMEGKMEKDRASQVGGQPAQPRAAAVQCILC